MGILSVSIAEIRKMDHKLVLVSVVVVVLGVGDVVRAGCDTENLNPAVAKDDKNYAQGCIDVLAKQVRMEFEASIQYLLMAAQFSQDTYHLPGVAGMFWKHADEEREHGKAFIEYLRMRGYHGNDFFESEPVKPILEKNTWTSVAEVTGEDDPHAADWL